MELISKKNTNPYERYSSLKKNKKPVGPGSTKKVNRSAAGNFIVFFFLVLLAFFMAIPMIFVFVSSIKPLEEFFIFPPRFFTVRRPTLNNFSQLFQITANLWVPFYRYVFNSLFVSIVSTFGHLLLASMAAYPLALHNFPGKKLLDKMIVLSLMFTVSITLVPQYIIMAKLGIINTYLALILPTVGGAMGCYLMYSYMMMIPRALLESAKIDGAGEMRIWWSIVMPSVKPAYITLLIMSFQAAWATTGGGLVYNEALKGLPAAMAQISAGGMARAGVGAAAQLFMILPPIIIFLIFQKQVIETFTTSGIKG